MIILLGNGSVKISSHFTKDQYGCCGKKQILNVMETFTPLMDHWGSPF